MNKENKFLLYQLNPLKRLKEEKPKEKGIKEKHIENLFCQNLENIFSGWISLNQQQYLEHPERDEENCIVDSLAFNKSGKGFLIIEYKREKAAELVYQVEKYIECLEDEEKGICIRNRNKLVNILNNNEAFKKTKGIWREEEIKWDETKAICITTEIHGYQKILKRKPRKNIHVLEIKFYEENFLSIDCEKLPDWITIEKNKKMPSYEGDENKSNYAQTIEEIAKLEWMRPTTKRWLIEVDSYLSSFFFSNSLIKKIKIKKNSYPVISYEKPGKRAIVVSVVPKVSQINVYWNVQEASKLSDGLVGILSKYQIEYKETEHSGIGNWHFPIINSDDSCQHLKKFIQELQN